MLNDRGVAIRSSVGKDSFMTELGFVPVPTTKDLNMSKVQAQKLLAEVTGYKRMASRRHV